VVEAALLLQDRDPSGDYCYVEDLELSKRPAGYEAAKKVCIDAKKVCILQKSLHHLSKNDRKVY
jgi:hypothetical protein